MNEFLQGFAAEPLLIYIASALLLMLITALSIRGLIRRRARIRRAELDPYRITIHDIDQMEGADFERYLHRFFVELGYEEVYKTQESKDFGADLVFTDREGFRNVLQAKRYQPGSRIGLSAVQEIYSSMRYYEADRSIVLASAGYTASCETLAGVNGVRLLDRDDLLALIEDFQSGEHEAAMDRIESEPELIESPWSAGPGSSPKKAVLHHEQGFLSRRLR
ncbi:restriction endonuclease [Paenibacillus albidus]|uniref:restriction endonuclease n=1 Tax=Paenibacillus albidus TaxID=2041023 RepID=UPI001BE55A85|nr:restriction endonuclease [Paenibacillus albidus]MBT2292125.1 restriction endonuclease [Paenibacillus albidus]